MKARLHETFTADFILTWFIGTFLIGSLSHLEPTARLIPIPCRRADTNFILDDDAIITTAHV